MKNQGVIIFTLIVVAIILIVARIFNWPEQNKIATDFASCAEAGFPIIESYPRQCIDRNQQIFKEKVALAPEAPSKALLPQNTSTSSPKNSNST